MKDRQIIVIIIFSVSVLLNIISLLFFINVSELTAFLTIDRLIAFITLQSVLFNVVFSSKARMKNSTEIRSISENTDKKLQIFEQKQDIDSTLMKRSLLEVQTSVRRLDREIGNTKKAVERTEAVIGVLKEFLDKKE